MADLRQDLEALARLYDIQLSYFDIKGATFVASDEALLALLPQLGAPVRALEDVPAALVARRLELAHRVLEPVLVAWGEEAPQVTLQLPADAVSGPLLATVTLEGGERFELSQDLSTLARDAAHEVEGQRFVRVHFGLGRNLPFGYHRLAVELAGARHEAALFAAPEAAWLPETPRHWGVFAPTYALRSATDLGVGGLAELERLIDFTAELGGHVVGTLPLTSTFLRELASPSPYTPVSRLFWNELYLDLERLPELASCAPARARMESAEFKAEAEALRARSNADHVGAMALVRSVLAPLAEHAFAADSPHRAELEAALASQPRLVEYARFRAVVEQRGDSWHGWPEALKAGPAGVTDADLDEAAFRYHAYVQVRMAQQVEALAARASADGGGLYLDMPLGVHPDGFDAWAYRDQFLSAASAGAPPDDLFAGGQDWGFRPLSPHAVRASGYAYVIACIKQQMACAGALRVDHVMGLHRLFCIPHGMPGSQGVYIQYRAEELYAILTIESHRERCFIIGEDLGTVPDEVRAAMDRHRLLRMYVMQFALQPDRARAVAEPPAQAVASVNTHDTPTFASFWEGKDIDTRVALGHTSPQEAEAERAGRGPLKEAVIGYLQDHHVLGEATRTADVLGGALNLAASSDVRLLLVNLEDLWGETQAQNVPGTVTEHPNWQTRCQYPLEGLLEVPGLFGTLREIHRRRQR